MAIILSDNIQNNSNKPMDSKYGPWDSLTLAQQGIPAVYRHLGLTVGLKLSGSIVEYWFKEGLTDDDLELKTVEDDRIVTVISVTHVELLDAIASSSLAPATYYRITDYQTKHIIPTTNVLNTGPTEHLILQAYSTNKLSVEGFSLDYPTDRIRYDPNNVLCEDGVTKRKGWIYWRKDTKLNNEVEGFDFRHAVFRRYLMNPDEWNPTGSYGYMSVIKHTPSGKCYTSNMFTANTTNPTGSGWTEICTIAARPYLHQYSTTGGKPYSCNTILLDTGSYVDYHLFNPNRSSVTAGTSDYNNFTGTNILMKGLSISSNIVFINDTAGGQRCRNITMGPNCSHWTFADGEMQNLTFTGLAFNNYVNGHFYNNIIQPYFAFNFVNGDRWSENNTYSSGIMYNYFLGRNTFNEYFSNMTNSIMVGNSEYNIFYRKLNALVSKTGVKGNTFAQSNSNEPTTNIRTGTEFNNNYLGAGCKDITFGDNNQNNNFIAAAKGVFFGNNTKFNTFNQPISGSGTSSIPLILSGSTFNAPVNNLQLTSTSSSIYNTVINIPILNKTISSLNGEVISYKSPDGSIWINGIDNDGRLSPEKIA